MCHVYISNQRYSFVDIGTMTTIRSLITRKNELHEMALCEYFENSVSKREIVDNFSMLLHNWPGWITTKMLSHLISVILANVHERICDCHRCQYSEIQMMDMFEVDLLP